ncbi:hypothetical protein A4F89_02200 [Polynucleobacter asymbioticus]|uniref:Uncharacterized protein n=2 Tax=Polynucleobacter asymbioticus TaxID=576611 RepID=A0AAC9IWU6_9BURK|nr:hypothetical protein A4F89_02200 [Polynucleobacter asymbioticus]APC00518.1 hypothetical protein AOC25_02205 [Polynucleobacter asymbioticus]
MELVAHIVAHRFSLAAKKDISVDIRCCNAANTSPLADFNKSYVIYSLLHYLEQPNVEISLIEKRLTKLCTQTIECHNGLPYFITIFQYLDRLNLQDDLWQRNAIIRRIREINLIALRLSQSNMCGIIDLDSLFTRIGGQNVRTDYTLKGVTAHQIAADFVSTVLIESHVNFAGNLDADTKDLLMSGGYEGILKRSSQRLLRDENNKTKN